MSKNEIGFLLVLFLTPNLPADCSSVKSDSFEDLGNVVLGAPKMEGRLRILQITDLHRFPKGWLHQPISASEFSHAGSSARPPV
jgi:hypothetical protein